MTRIDVLGIIIGISLVSTFSWASECQGRGNSCWEAANDSNTTMKVNCNLPYGAHFSCELAPGQKYHHQFDRSWGDGLGFPEPSNVSCRIERNGQHGVQTFRTINWGDHVEIKQLSNLQAQIIDQSTWSREKKSVYVVKDFSR